MGKKLLETVFSLKKPPLEMLLGVKNVKINFTLSPGKERTFYPLFSDLPIPWTKRL